MSRTPEVITNKTAEVIRNILVGVGLIFALVTIGAFEGNRNPLLPIILSAGSFFAAAKVKVHWHKDAEISRYK